MGDSSNEEEDANWKAAIASIAATTTYGHKVFATSTTNHTSSTNTEENDGDDKTQNPQKLKHYQIKAQKLLDQMLEQSLEIVKDPPVQVPDGDALFEDSGVQLFKKSPAGIVFEHKDEIQWPREKPKILPGLDIDKKSKKFRKQIKSVAVDGASIIEAACDSAKRSFARLEAKEVAAREKAKREEERIAAMKKIRGERWLPSIAKEIQLNGTSKEQVLSRSMSSSL